MFATDENKKIYDIEVYVIAGILRVEPEIREKWLLVQVNEVFVFLSYKGFESQLGVFCLSQLLTE